MSLYEYLPRLGGRCAGAAASLVAAAGLSLATYAPPARAFSGSLTNITGYALGAAGAASTLTGGGFLKGVAARQALTNAAGKIITVPLSLTVGPTAGRVIAGACYTNPLACGIVGAAAGIAAWFMLSNISYDPALGWRVGETQSAHGYYYMWPKQGGGFEKISSTSKSGVAGAVAGKQCKANSACTRSAWSVYDTPYNWMMWNDPNQGGDFVVTLYRHDTDGKEVHYMNGVYSLNVGDIEVIEERPADQHDIDVHVEDHPLTPTAPYTDDVANQSPVPVPVLAPEVEEVAEPLGDPYPGPDPMVGPWKRDYVEIKGKPDTADPLDVEATPKTRDVDNPNTPEDETPAVDDPNAETPAEDPCKFHPGSVMCTEFGEAPGDEVPKSTVTVSWVAENLGLPAGCPQPISVEGHTISYQSACDAMSTIRPVVILIAGVMALLIVIAAVRGAS